MDVLMKYNKDMRGKEVIDGYGNVLGKVTDIEWDESTRQLKNFEIGNGGFMEMLGRGDKKILSFDIVDAIGEKILIKTGATEPVKEDISKVKNISRVKDSSKAKVIPTVENTSNAKVIPTVENNPKAKDSSIVTHTSRIKDISKFNISKIKDISKVKNFTHSKDTKNVEDIEKADEDDNLNIDDIEDKIEDFRIRNSF